MNCFVLLPVVNILVLTLPHIVANVSTEDDISNKEAQANSNTTTVSDSSPARVPLERSSSGVNSTYDLQSSTNKSDELTNTTEPLKPQFAETNSSIFAETIYSTSANATDEKLSVSSFSVASSTPITTDNYETLHNQSTPESVIRQVTNLHNASSALIESNQSFSRTALLPNNIQEEAESSSAYYTIQIIIIVLSAVAVVLISAYLTKELAGKRFNARTVRERFFPRNRRSTIGKRYSDISLQMMNNEAVFLDLPEEFVEEKDRLVGGKALVVNCIVHESDPPEQATSRTQEKCSPRSSEGEWL